MNSSNFLANPGNPFFADASVIINLNATYCAAAIIGAFPNEFVVTSNVRRELALGAINGHECGQKLEKLIRDGLVGALPLESIDELNYRSLIEGESRHTLDDGEAATIACAVAHNGVALIDDRKAKTIGASRFPNLNFASTVDLLIHELVRERIGASAQNDAVFLALRDARMNVPGHTLREVVELIGRERAAECRSLPRSVRS
ncbi:MAG: hypothetical protein F4Z40_00710 [Chloroflexi bacterium]|nr:hypothetical protein [Chloroflexota bacterium]